MIVCCDTAPMQSANGNMRSYHLKFYIPIILLWGAVALSTLDPLLIQSDIRLDPSIQRNDLLRIDPGTEVMLDDVVIYRLNRSNYIARAVGQPGDEILLGLDGNSIMRNGERVVLVPRGSEIATLDSGVLTVDDGQVAILVQNARRNAIIAAISRESIRGPVDKVFRYSELSRSDRRAIGFFSMIVLALVLLPYAAFVQQQPRTLFRMVVLVTHTFLTLVMAGGLLVASLPDDPMRVGLVEPIWWWFPLAVVAGFRLELVMGIGVFLAFQWLIRRRTSGASLVIAAVFLVAADEGAKLPAAAGMSLPASPIAYTWSYR